MLKNEIDLNQNDEQVSFEEIFKKISETLSFFKQKFLIIFIASILGGLGGFWVAFTDIPIYSAKLRFVNKETGGSSASISSLGSLGSLIGGASGSASPFDRTLAIIGSEKIVGNALFKIISVKGKDDLAINHLIEIQELHKAWIKDSTLSKVKFTTGKIDLSTFSFPQRKAYKSILNMLISVKATMFGKAYDKKSGVFEIIINTKNEEFSIEFAKVLFNELEQFMYNQSVNSSEKNIIIIRNKIDSIKTELNSVQNALARNTDRTLGLLMQEDKVDQKKLMMKEQMLTIMYGEAQKNLETFRFINESINKGLEVIEFPFSPIQPNNKSKLNFTLVGFLYSGIICFGFLLFRRWVKESLLKQKN
jgi:hypothetical protein